MTLPQFYLPSHANFLLVETTLPQSGIGRRQLIHLQKPLEPALQEMISMGEVYGKITNQKNQEEFVKIENASYTYDNHSLVIIRSLSNYANNHTTIPQLFNRPTNLYLSFGTLSPSNFQDVYNQLNAINTNAQLFLSKNLPNATKENIGGVITATQTEGTPVVPTVNSEAFMELYKAAFGVTTNSYNTQNLSSSEKSRIQFLTSLMDYISNGDNLSKLIKLIDETK